MPVSNPQGQRPGVTYFTQLPLHKWELANVVAPSVVQPPSSSMQLVGTEVSDGSRIDSPAPAKTAGGADNAALLAHQLLQRMLMTFVMRG